MSKYKKVEDKWAGVDWSKSNKEIAEELGMTPQIAAYRRRILGKPGTHAEVRKFWKSLDWTKRDSVLAEETGKSQSLLCLWRKKLGHSRGTGKTKQFGRWKLIDPATIDFSKTDAELGRVHGVSRERIRQLRQRAELPSSKTITKQLGLAFRIPDGLNWNRPNLDVAEELGCCKGYASKLRKLSGACPAPIIRKYETKYDHSNVDWSKSYAEIAAELGCSIPTVYNYKKKLNLIGKKCRSTTAKTS